MYFFSSFCTKFSLFFQLNLNFFERFFILNVYSYMFIWQRSNSLSSSKRYMATKGYSDSDFVFYFLRSVSSQARTPTVLPPIALPLSHGGHRRQQHQHAQLHVLKQNGEC